MFQSVKNLILSKSQIQTCDQTNSQRNCSELLYVQLALQNGQGQGEELSFNVSNFTNQDGLDIALDSPLTVTLMKSNVEVSYNTLYRQDVNSNPVEKIIDSNYLSCSEGVYIGSVQLTSSTCTIARDSSGNVIQNSQGYCCACPLLTYLAGIRSSGTNRGDCGFLSNSMSASCLNFPNQWHSLYEVPSYQYNYFVTAQMGLKTKSGSTQTSDMVVSNSKKNANNGIFQITIVGDYTPTNPPPDLSSIYLLRPSESYIRNYPQLQLVVCR
jgi:Male gamete fusion factor